MGLIYPGVHSVIVRQILENFTVENFVETGTYIGDTARWASDNFRHVFTIERSKPLWQEARDKYKETENIEFILGDSAEVLRDLVPRLNGTTIFWLDAHWSGGLTYGEGDECALLKELEAIFESTKDNFVLIDDARLFLLPPPRPHIASQWPDLGQIMRIVEKHDGQYTVVMDDVIVIYPQSGKSILAVFFQDYATQQWNHMQVPAREPNNLIKYVKRFFRNKKD